MHTSVLKLNGVNVFSADSDEEGKKNFKAVEMFLRAQLILSGSVPNIEIEEIDHVEISKSLKPFKRGGI